MKKYLLLFVTMLMSVGMYAATVVTITEADFPEFGKSFTKDGVTITDGDSFNPSHNLWYPTFTSSVGNFTKIEISAEDVALTGEGWSGGNTWTGNASSVSTDGESHVFVYYGSITITCTIEEPEPEPEPAGGLNDVIIWDDSEFIKKIYCVRQYKTPSETKNSNNVKDGITCIYEGEQMGDGLSGSQIVMSSTISSLTFSHESRKIARIEIYGKNKGTELYGDWKWNSVDSMFVWEGTPALSVAIQGQAEGKMNLLLISKFVFTLADGDEPQPDFAGEGTAESPYLIADAAGWNTFATRVNEGNTYNGVYFQLTNDIAIETMVGTNDHNFNGVFDGDGHTITATINTDAQFSAPFAYTYGATIKNLHTTGTITTTSSNAGGVVGRNGSANLIMTNVSSDMTINSTVNGVGSHGGLVGYTINATISGCAFTGKLLGENTTRFGGLIGWKTNTADSQVDLTDCLFAPSEITMSATNSKTFVVLSNGGVANISNCYYTEAYGTDQGKLMRSISVGDGVTVENAGTATVYDVSGITAYGTGIKYNDVLYGGNEDELSLNLSGSDYGYKASTGTLSGDANPYALAMADADCQIQAASEPEPAEVTVVFAANSKTVERTVTLPHEFLCSYFNGNGELDAIIQELYGISDGHCSDYKYPVASGNEAVSAGSYSSENYITISAAFEGTATVSGSYWNWDAYDGDGDWMDYSLTISIKDNATGVETIQVENAQADEAQAAKARKFFRNGKLFIKKNDEIYTVAGARVE